MKSIAALQRQQELLRMEYEYERQEYQRKLEGGLSGRTHDAGCLYPVEVGGLERDALDHLVLTIRYEASEEELENDFEPGKPVAFFHTSGDTVTEMPHQCFVEKVGSGVMALRVGSVAAAQSIRETAKSRLVGVQLVVDSTSFRAMEEALRQAMRRTDEGFVRLRETLVGVQAPEFRDLPRVSFPWLNESQAVAVQTVLEAREVAVVHGPPGTGKTTTLVEAIIETLQREEQVMVSAPSNAAVDWISLQLMRRGVSVVRVGNPLRISDEMLDCSYERRYAAHPDYGELWSIRRLLREQAGGNGKESKREHLRKLNARKLELEIKIENEVFGQARVVACTLIGASYQVLEHRHFSTLFIDEAAQALEGACWVAIGKCDRVVFSGDHQQLPPTIKCPAAAHGGLEQTLMQKVVREKPECVRLLRVQYRMNRTIMGFSSEWFYGGKLEASELVGERLVTPLDSAMTWIDTKNLEGGESQNQHTQSRSNIEEARLLIHTLRDYIDMIGPTKIADEQIDFGIISPYRGQVRLIRRLLKMQHFFRKLRRQVTVNTVDGFQGQERDVIVISMVRANDEGQIGFLRDLRRMNVALTRAKMKVIIVGNSETLGRHRFYGKLMDYVRENGDWVEAPREEETDSSVR